MESLQMHTLGSWAGSVIDFLESHGHSKEIILAGTGLRPTLLSMNQTHYPIAELSQLWRYAYDQYGDGVGLKVAAHFRPSHWSTVGLALQSCGTVDEFICRICRYIPLISNAIKLRYEPSPIAAKKVSTYFAEPVDLAHERVESYMASALALLKLMYGTLPELAQVDLTRPRPQDPSPWQAIFGTRIVWQADEFSIHLGQAMLARKVPHMDERLSKMHETDLSERLAQLSHLSLSQKIQREILHMLPNGEPSVKEVAATLHMSTRSLQRHLVEEGIGFRQLVDSVRLQMAQHYLSSTKTSLADIALLIGFSNQSNFSNAFKRWTQLTPNQYREQHQP